MNTNDSGNLALRKGFSFVDLSAGIAQMYKNPAENVTPNVITSEKQAVKEIKEIVSKFKESNEWDEQMALCQQLMSDVKGGACEYPLFVQDVPSLVPMLSHCVQNLRSTLVKFGCLCIVQLAQVLQEKFDSTASTILGFLFPPTTHATAIIACSCKCAIESIVHNCRGKFVLNTIIANASSKSQEHRNIVSDSLLEIVTSWPKLLVSQNIRPIEQVLKSLGSDAGLDSRNSAKSAFEVLLSKNLIKSIPESVVTSQKIRNNDNKKQFVQPTRKRMSISPPKKVKKTNIEENSKKATFKMRTSTSANDLISKSNSPNSNKTEVVSFDFKQKSKEREIIVNIRKYKNSQKMMKENAEYIVNGLISCLDSESDDDVSSALRLTEDVIGPLASYFEKNLETILEKVLKFATNQKFLISQNARHLLSSIPAHFKGDMLLRTVYNIEPNNFLLVFFQNVIRKDQSVLKDSEISENILKVCCAINETNTEARYKSMTLTLIENIKRINNKAFTDFVSSAEEQQIKVLQNLSLLPQNFKVSQEKSTKVNNTQEKTAARTKKFSFGNTEKTAAIPISLITNKAKEEPKISKDDISVVVRPRIPKVVKDVDSHKIESIIEKVEQTENKVESLVELKNYFLQQKSFSKKSIQLLVDLIHSEFYTEVEDCIEALVAEVEKEQVISEALSLFLLKNSEASIDFLTFVLKKAGSYRYTPNVKSAISKLRDYVVCTNARMRRSSLMCIVELKISIGNEVDVDLMTLEETQKILLQRYIDKRVNNK